MFWLTRSTNFIITRARRCGFQAAHSFCASTAPATAASTSADDAIGTLACTSPVLGFITSAVRVDCPGGALAVDEMRNLCGHELAPRPMAEYLDILVFRRDAAQGGL